MTEMYMAKDTSTNSVDVDTKQNSILVYDIEILKAVPPYPPAEKDPRYEYCEGWHDHANMGITCICAYDYATDRYRVFTSDNLIEFILLSRSRRYLVGFNNLKFDNPVIALTAGYMVGIKDTIFYDILAEIWISLGYDPNVFTAKSHGGYGLDAMAEVNLGLRKTGNGAAAPKLWQDGHYGEVVDYCIEDCRLTKLLFDKVIAGIPLDNPKESKPLTLRKPF